MTDAPAASDFYSITAEQVALIVQEHGPIYFANPQGVIPVAWLPDRVMQAQPFAFRPLFLGPETQRKILTKHREVEPAHLALIQSVVDHGALYQDQDRANHLVLFEHRGQWWRLVLKCTGKGEAFISTFHRARATQAERQSLVSTLIDKGE